MKDLKLPDELRTPLKEPFGILIPGDGEDSAGKVRDMLSEERVIVVGDIAYENMRDAGVKPHLAIVDFKVKRKPYKTFPTTVMVKNPAGFITSELWESIEKNLDKGGIIGVDGEEDLAVIPAVLESDFGDVVLYGQPDEGMVYIKVDEDIKQKTAMFLKIMQSLQA